mmetsp:Transcript_51696/g.143150  ORF Transcript_51696/g.143150 Transcript_51696/m.143150 type:complete len:132 (-) Transcript_51696:80-475(-)
MGFSAKSKPTLVLATGLGVSFMIVIIACAFYGNWWPLTMLVPFSLYPIPLVFTDGLGKDLAVDSSNAGKRAWYLMGQCLIGALGSSLFGLPVLMYHVQAIESEQFWLWMVANVIATCTSGYFLVKNGKDDM